MGTCAIRPAPHSATANGRMGYLLYRPELARRMIIPQIGRRVFAVNPGTDDELLAALPPMLDRIDAWIAGGVLGGEQPNAADFMVAPSLALMFYRSRPHPPVRRAPRARARRPAAPRAGVGVASERGLT